MNALLILIPITLVLAVLAVGIFFWAVRHQQFEDLDTPKILPLLDDPPAEEPAQAGPQPPQRDVQSTGTPGPR